MNPEGYNPYLASCGPGCTPATLITQLPQIGRLPMPPAQPVPAPPGTPIGYTLRSPFEIAPPSATFPSQGSTPIGGTPVPGAPVAGQPPMQLGTCPCARAI